MTFKSHFGRTGCTDRVEAMLCALAAVSAFTLHSSWSWGAGPAAFASIVQAGPASRVSRVGSAESHKSTMNPSFCADTSRHLSGSALAAFCAASAAIAILSRRQRCSSHSLRSSSGVTLCAKRSSVETFMIQGKCDVASISMKCAGISGYMDLSAVVFFSLGVSEETIAAAAGGALGLHGACQVFIVDCHGIIGWDGAQKKNIELMEKGCGIEYGGVGGNGGTGLVVVAFRGPAYATTVNEARPTKPGESHMFICNEDAKYEQAESGAVYGGMAKKCFMMDSSTGFVKEISSFVVSGTVTSAVSTFSGDAANAAQSIVKSMPKAAEGVKAAGYFPCLMKGVNKYGRDGAEPAEFTVVGMQDVRLFGMFAHGELGPPEGTVLVGGVDVGGSIEETPLEKHSMVTVMALLKDM